MSMPSALSPSFDADEFAQRLRARSAERRLNQRALAKAVGTHHNVVARWVRGERSPSARHLADLAVVLETSLDWLLLGSAADDERDGKTTDDLMTRLAELAPVLAELAGLAGEAAGRVQK
ncbi:MAG: helix-turn-helix domain-containing protein [Solirubrobacteraceae bacterium]